MGKHVRHVGQDPASGRLFYRRAFPADLRPFLPASPRRELKVPLGVHRALSAAAMRQWEAADRQWAEEVEAARTTQRLQAARDAGTFDPLTPELLRYLTNRFTRDWHLQDEEALRARGGDQADRALGGWDEMLDEFREWRVEGDLEALEGYWGGTADRLLEAAGLRLSPTDPEGRETLLWEMNTAALRLSADAKRRLRGDAVPVPHEPTRPAAAACREASTGSAESFERVVEGIMARPSQPLTETTKESVRTALRFFREAFGTPPAAEITRAMVSEWADLLASRPARLPPEHRAVPLRELVELYRDRPAVPRLSTKTRTQHLSSLGARWKDAQRAGRLGTDAANPFTDQAPAHSKRRGLPKGFSGKELSAILSLPVFTSGDRPAGGRGEASSWLPLLLLFTGARPEEIAQLLVSDLLEDPATGRWLLRITDEGEHPHKGPQRLKNDATGRTFPLPRPLLDLGLLRYRQALRTAGEEALFPLLRPKGKRGNLYDSFGGWWSKYLTTHGIVLEGTGRQPMREFRHTWSTAARASGITREAMAYIQGHKVPNATAGEGYGVLAPLGLAIDKWQLEGVGLAGLRPWRPPNPD